jgi:cytoskeletal protein CcmA (bactofilin family)
MSDTRGVLIVGPEAVLNGEIKNAKRIEVLGVVEGGVSAGEVVVHPNGRMSGKITSNTADVRGNLQGDVRIHNLISIRSTGNVEGTVKYGRLAMEEGAELAAQVRNVPPSLTGDLDLTVARSGSVRITRADLSAFDPDDTADKLTFSVSNANGGFVSKAGGARRPVDTFTQSELQSGKVLFVHDGSDAATASFDVIVADEEGATSGAPKTVNVAVRA